MSIGPRTPGSKLAAAGMLLAFTCPSPAADCNSNGIDDSRDLSPRVLFTPGHQAGSTAGGLPFSIAAADLDGDGKPDLAVADFGRLDESCRCHVGGSINVFLGEGGGAFREPVQHASEESPRSVAIGDLNGDGSPDLVAAGGDGSGERPGFVSVLLNGGDGTFRPGETFPRAWPPLAVAIGDFSGDRILDVAAAGDGVSVFFNRGDGTLGTAVHHPGGGPLTGVIAADLDGDGHLDLAMANNGFQSLTVLLNKGNGDFHAAAHLPVVEGRPMGIASADLDGDGDVDLAMTIDSYPRGMMAFINAGGGVFQRADSKVVQSQYVFTTLIALDLDGDGDPDIALGGRMVELFENLGDGRFQAGPRYATEGHISSLAAAALDADGRVDLVASGEGGIISLLNRTLPPVSQDTNRNGAPDECEARFHRGDPDNNGTMNISDGVGLLGFLFLGADPPACREAADVDDDGAVNIADGIAILSFLFLGGPPPEAPGPPGRPCGLDADRPGSPGSLGCLAYDHCGPSAPGSS